MHVPLLPRSWWTKHPEAAAFVRTLFGTMRIVDMPAAIAAKFGPDIKPSKSAISRYMSELRGGAGLGQKRLHERPKSAAKVQTKGRQSRKPSARPAEGLGASRSPREDRSFPPNRA